MRFTSLRGESESKQLCATVPVRPTRWLHRHSAPARRCQVDRQHMRVPSTGRPRRPLRWPHDAHPIQGDPPRRFGLLGPHGVLGPHPATRYTYRDAESFSEGPRPSAPSNAPAASDVHGNGLDRIGDSASHVLRKRRGSQHEAFGAARGRRSPTVGLRSPALDRSRS